MSPQGRTRPAEPDERCGHRGPFVARHPHPNYVCFGCGEVVVVGKNQPPIEFAGFLRTKGSRTALLCPHCGTGYCPECARGMCRAPRATATSGDEPQAAGSEHPSPMRT